MSLLPKSATNRDYREGLLRGRAEARRVESILRPVVAAAQEYADSHRRRRACVGPHTDPPCETCERLRPLELAEERAHERLLAALDLAREVGL